MAASSYSELSAYKKAFELAMEIFEATKKFPAEEKYSLTDQIRRSSRSVAICIGEAFRKRQYPAHFSSKSSDGDMENTETKIWLAFAKACKYLQEAQWKGYDSRVDEVGRLLNHMIHNPEKYGIKKKQ